MLQRIITITVLISHFYLPLISQEGDMALRTGSQLTIHGESNINKFNCRYSFNKPEDSLTFDIIAKGEEIIMRNVQLSIPIKQTDCGNRFLNKDFRATLDAEKHPNIRIRITRLPLPRFAGNGLKKSIRAKITVAGVTRWEQIDYKISLVDDYVFNMKGNLTINTESFDIEKQKRFLGAVKVSNEVDISFLFKFGNN